MPLQEESQNSLKSLNDHHINTDDAFLTGEKRAPMRFGKRAPMRFGKRGFEDDLNEFKILRSVRAPMRFGKRSEYIKRAPMRFGKRAPMRFGKRDFEDPSFFTDYDESSYLNDYY